MNYLNIPFYNKILEQQFNNHLTSYLPYLSHWNKTTILCKDNSLVSFIKIKGYTFETGNDEDLDIKKHLRNNLFKSLNDNNIYLHFYIINSKINHTYESTYEYNSFASYLNNQWNKKQSNGNQYQKEIYLAIKYHFSDSINFVEKLNNIISGTNIYKQINEAANSLQELSKRIIKSLRDYDPVQLKIIKKNNIQYCEMLGFLAQINNLQSKQKVILPKVNINQHISQSRITFKKNYLTHKNINKKYTSILALNTHPSTTSSSILDNLLYLNFEFIIHQSFAFSEKTSILHKIEIHQNQMIQTQDKSHSQIYEISEALDMATSGKIAFGYHSLQFLCIANSKEALEEYTSSAFTEMVNSGITPVREDLNLEMSYLSLFPGNEQYLMRKTLINTLNLSGYASLHNFPVGEKYNNHWGKYTSLLETTAGTPYYFSFHAKGSDVGHTLIIGPTGAGKTVIMNFLSAQLQKFKPKMFFFDKDHGAEIFIRSINGVYNTIQTSAKCGFNPLQLPENEANKAFLFEWLSILVTTNDEELSSKDRQLIYQAISGNFKLKKEDRQLKNIAPFLGIPLNNNIAARLKIWYNNGAKANIFDNPTDSIEFTSARIFGFEMSNILQDKTALAPVLLYIFHKIQISLNGYPTTIILDEAWALIDNPIFKAKIKDWLKVLRKLNTFVVFATQSVEDATQSSISHTIVQQTATQIFLPNLKATETYKKVFMLTEREYTLIKTTDPKTRFFLIKQNKESVIARIDLSDMPEIISVLSGKSKTIGILKKLINKYGEKVQNWLPKFHLYTKT